MKSLIVGLLITSVTVIAIIFMVNRVAFLRELVYGVPVRTAA